MKRDNGEIGVKRVKNTTSNWKTGKRMHLSMKPWSLNQYCLAKVWYRTKSVPSGSGHIKKITSAMKQWLYQDMYIKPEEAVMFRPRHMGGLGVHHVLSKAAAGMVRTFMETAANPNFRRRLDHYDMYQYHVRVKRGVKNPGVTPYYTK